MIAAPRRRVARSFTWWWALAAAAAALAAPAATAPPVHLVVESIDVDGRRLLAFGVRGLAREMLVQLARPGRSRDQWLELFSVRVETERAAPILGDYRADEAGLWLVPSFPPERGVRYVALFNPAVLDDPVAAGSPEPLRAYLAVEIDVDGDGDNPAPATRVSAVHPSAGEVPENLLRVYVHFSAPMSRGNALRWVRLEHANGKPIADAFLPLDEELWDRGSTRLTLLLDPSRIKSGLVPHAELGRALEQGHDVTLAIDEGWPDASGRPLAAGFRRSYRVGAADQDPPDPSRWRLDDPRRAGGRQPLRVTLGETLDHALLHRLVWVEDAAGRKVSGSVALGDDERSWSFTPAAPWSAGAYSLRVDRRLEDLAGNRIGRAFEVDLDRTPAAAATLDGSEGDAPVGVPFTVEP